MPSQNNTGRQYDKQHAITMVATAELAAHRFIAYDGGYPSAAGGAKAVQGVSETSAQTGEALAPLDFADGAIGLGQAMQHGRPQARRFRPSQQLEQ